MLKQILLVLMVVALFSGCSSAQREYVFAMNDSLEVMVPNYHRYLDEDETLKPIERETMKKASQDTLELSRKQRAKIDGP